MQAWTELALDDGDADLSDDSEGEWGALSGAESSSGSKSSLSAADLDDSERQGETRHPRPAAAAGRLACDTSSSGCWETGKSSSGTGSEDESSDDEGLSSSRDSGQGVFDGASFSIPPHMPSAKQRLAGQALSPTAAKPAVAACKAREEAAGHAKQNKVATLLGFYSACCWGVGVCEAQHATAFLVYAAYATPVNGY